MNFVDQRSRVADLEAFAGTSPVANNLPVAAASTMPADRVFGAQPMKIKRDPENIFKQIRIEAAAAGENFYYRFPVRAKIKDPETGKETWGTDYIEGPTIKCANSVSRLFGNCDVDCRVLDVGSHWVFHARFMDLETGYSLTRPFQQRKNQGSVRGDSGRQEDIAFQIGTSKAIRNVITNALELYTTFAWQEAKDAIIEKVGKKLPFYKEKVAERLKELNIDISRVEAVRGRPLASWLATDVAKTIAELQAINDGMATADETFPPKETKTDSETGEVLNNFASTTTEGAAATDDAETKTNAPAADKQQAQGSQPAETGPHATAGATEGAEKGDGGNVPSNASAPSTTNGPKDPANDAEYDAYATKWIAEQIDPEEPRARWAREKNMRNKANVSPETRDRLETAVKAKVAELKKKS
ncbi:hypothetical protein [Bradyrhizobium erythrophlei]|uniref:Uncharacterized protein n=1 Tax=Bradyrhizobium erythrophlei TaxID=1437360 RepID=A0A1M5NCU8_9BRAD|nr:hypothetical protein [Bradyrhizobium erythrophlei]SHG87292.1 hypothetical protein SAMN05443248_2938 [Bradyrhizobium erythrophlei]